MKRHLGTGRLPFVDLRRHCPPVHDQLHRWGDHGYGYLPYAFLASPDLTWDFWTMRRVS